MNDKQGKRKTEYLLFEDCKRKTVVKQSEKRPFRVSEMKGAAVVK